MSTKTLTKTGNGWGFYKTELFRLEPNSVDIISGYSFLLWFFKKTDQQQFRKGLIGISSFSPRKPKAGTQGRNVETGIAFETMGVLLSWFAFCGLLGYLSSTTQAHPPRGSTPHRGLDLQLAIKNCPADILAGQLNGDSSLTEAPSSQPGLAITDRLK